MKALFPLRPVLRIEALPLVLAAVSVVLMSRIAPAQQLGYAELLRQMTDLDWLWLPAPAGERCLQFSSYDRASDKGPDDPKAWYSNGDAGQFLRQEERAGKTEQVMADVAGPGVVVRIWSANPKGLLHFYFDGAREPQWSVDFAKLTSGKLDGIPAPLAAVCARGWNCHLPLPFAKHLKVTASEKDFYYQVNVRLLGGGASVASFVPAWLQQHAEAIRATVTELNRTAAQRCEQFGSGISGGGTLGGGTPGGATPGSATPGSATPSTGTRGTGTQATGTQGTGTPASVPARAAGKVRLQVSGGQVVRAIRARLSGIPDHHHPDRPAPVPTPDLMRGITVTITVDGETIVKVPYADLFAAAPWLRPHTGWPIAVDADGSCYSFFPIPVRSNAEIALTSESEVQVKAELEIRGEPREIPANALTFHAAWHQAKHLATRPFSDHLVLNAEGPGRFIGCALMVRNPTKAWWGEGDEKFYVDGEAFPSTFGTGTEDYFGYAWCSNEVFTHPYHAQPQCDGPGNFGFTSVSRWQILDQVPFQSSFRFDLEVWHWDQKVKIDLASTAYWYAPVRARSGLPDLPPFGARKIEPCVLPPVHAVKGALEGESLKTLAMTGGKRQKQDMGGYEGGKWSQEAQLWWTGAKVGDKLTLALPVAEAGRQRLLVAFTKANDYGQVQCWLGDHKLGDPIDLYAASVSASGELALGAVELAAGEAQLTLEIVGKHEKALPRYMVGLDYVRLARD